MVLETEGGREDHDNRKLGDQPPGHVKQQLVNADKPGPAEKMSRTERAASTDHHDDEEEEDEDEEPRLRYEPLTAHLKQIYRNEDSTSIFATANDKMVVGTHNGHIHVFAIPSMKSIRSYHAHSASISAISISALTALALSSTTATKTGSPKRLASPRPHVTGTSRLQGVNPLKQSTVASTLYIASASIDGNVCVASLSDPKDVLLRSFGRPLKAIGLSPMYKSDRNYLSGGLAGILVLSTGGQVGTKEVANVSGAAAMTSGWLGSLGLGSSAGKDQILHSGEGAISTIQWSLSGKFVVWVNEHGIKLMRSNLYLESEDQNQAWQRISHIDHPNRPGWDELAGTWKAYVQWVDEANLESEAMFPMDRGDEDMPSYTKRPNDKATINASEKLVVGWSGMVWIISVQSNTSVPGTKSVSKQKAGTAEILTILRTDCIISGVALYTPSLLVILAYITPAEASADLPEPTKKGRFRRQNALQPEMRIINVNTKEEVNIADTLPVNKFENLGSTDYHLSILPDVRESKVATRQRGAMEVIGGSIEAIGGGIWDATMLPTKLFSSNASVRSVESQDSAQTRARAKRLSATFAAHSEEPDPLVLSQGMKIFIHGPYDCLIATKPTLADHLQWLIEHENYSEAWEFLTAYPEAVERFARSASPSRHVSPSRRGKHGQSADHVYQSEDDDINACASALKQEKRALGEKWLTHLTTNSQWSEAGQTAALVLDDIAIWESWVHKFMAENQYNAIIEHIPTDEGGILLSPKIYEDLLRHLLSTDLNEFEHYVEAWSTNLFEPVGLIADLESELVFAKGNDDDQISTRDEVQQSTRRFRLISSLAKIYLLCGKSRKALNCFIQIQQADAAMDLIASAHIIDAVSNDIPGFLLLRVSKEMQAKNDLEELAAQTHEPIQLLVAEAHQGTVTTDIVIRQLQSHFQTPNPYLYFYFRALWQGDSSIKTETARSNRARGIVAEERLLAAEGRGLVSDHADTAIIHFATYDRPLLMTFLKATQSYTLSLASQICEERAYIPELIYILSKEGRTTQALHLIIDRLNDVSQAIEFVKQQNDTVLWNDLLDYSMKKPSLIRALLEEVGTAIDPLELVSRIPPGLEIEGLGTAVQKILKEYQVQDGICQGVAQVLRSEVLSAIQTRDTGLRKAIKFRPGSKENPTLCSACERSLVVEPAYSAPFLLGFPCKHVFHLSCLLNKYFLLGAAPPEVLQQFMLDRAWTSNDHQTEDASWSEADEKWHLMPCAYDRSIGPKIDRARLLRSVLAKGCPLEDD